MFQFSDPVMQSLVEKVQSSERPVTDISPAEPRLFFQSLAESIVSQQLSTKVADTIIGRVRSLVGPEFVPQRVLALPHEELRLVGLSNAKASYIRNIAEFWDAGRVVPEKLVDLGDEEIITLLTEIKGVGRWTVEMFLIFTLARPDVFSVGDYGLRKAVMRTYDLSENTKPDEIGDLSTRWSPERSFASRVLWRSLDLPM